jgi:hypothetical protein
MRRTKVYALLFITCTLAATVGAYVSTAAVQGRGVPMKRDKCFIVNMEMANSKKKMSESFDTNEFSPGEREVERRILELQKNQRDAQTRLVRLENKVLTLESTVRELCSVIVHCDDIAFMERQARCIGEIYFDKDFEIIRAPRLLRQEIYKLAMKNNMTLQPLMHTWRSNPPIDVCNPDTGHHD